MRGLKEFKEIMKIAKGKLSDYESSLGDLSMSYGETYADFMMSSTSNDIFVRVDEDENGSEYLYIICDDDASQKKKDALKELIDCTEVIEKLTDNEIQTVKSDTETIIELMSLNDKNTEETGELISEAVIRFWPYITGAKTVKDHPTENMNSEDTVDNKNGMDDSETDIESAAEDTEPAIETDIDEQPNEEINLNHGKVYIKDDLPDRNGSTRLIHRTIGDSSYQLFFQLPDESEHFVEITCSDSNGIIDTHSVMARNQFRYLIFPYSSDPKVLVSITVDGAPAYEGAFKIPYHLRLKKNEDFNEDIAKKPFENEYSFEEINTKEEIETVDLNIDVCLSEISSDAIKLLRGDL